MNKKKKWGGDNGIFTVNMPESVFDSVITEENHKAYQFKVFKEKLAGHAARKGMTKIPKMIRDLEAVKDKEFLTTTKPDRLQWTCIKKINMGTTEIPHWVERTIIKDKGLYKELMDLYLEAH